MYGTVRYDELPGPPPALSRALAPARTLSTSRPILSRHAVAKRACTVQPHYVRTLHDQVSQGQAPI